MTAGSQRYDSVSICLHWLMAAILIAGFFVGENSSHRQPDTIGYTWHASLGMTLLVLSLVRIAWRIGHESPPPPDGTPAWQTWLAWLIKIAFYILMLAIPLTGWLAHSGKFGAGTAAQGTTWLFWLVPLPPLGDGFGMAEAAEEMHELTVHLWLPLLGLHMAAALWHHYLQRDDVLLRMLPKWR